MSVFEQVMAIPTQPNRVRRNPYDFGEGWHDGLSRFWRDLFGVTARSGLSALARRIHALESRQAHEDAALQRLASAGAAKGVKPLIEKCDALDARVGEALRQLETAVEMLEADWVQRDEDKLAMDEVRAGLEGVRDALKESISRIEALMATQPAAWRDDIRRELDSLRNTPDAVTALLYGAETFAGAVARSLEDAQ